MPIFYFYPKPTSRPRSMWTNSEFTEITFWFIDCHSTVGPLEGATPPLDFTRPVRVGWAHSSALDTPRWSIYIYTWRISSISHCWDASTLPQRGQKQYQRDSMHHPPRPNIVLIRTIKHPHHLPLHITCPFALIWTTWFTLIVEKRVKTIPQRNPKWPLKWHPTARTRLAYAS